MYLILAIFLFIASGFAAIVESGKTAAPYFAQKKAERGVKTYIEPHGFDAIPEGDVRRELFIKFNDAYITMYVETENDSKWWYSVYKKYKVPSAKLSQWSAPNEFGVGSTKHFSYSDPEKRHRAVKEVTEILGYDISNVPQSQFWKVASDYEERFGFWSEVDRLINHPYAYRLGHIDMPIMGLAYLIEMKKNNGLPERMLYVKDGTCLSAYSMIQPFFNDEREHEIATPFIDNDKDAMDGLSVQIGFDVEFNGRQKTILAFAEKEGWIAHTYVNPALAYPEYGLLLFEKDQRWYNKWREVFGCAPVVRSEYEDKINNLLKRYHSYSEEKQAAEYAAAMSNQKPDEVFYPYHEIRH